MRGLRVVLMVAVLANLAILVVTQHVRATRIRYAIAQRSGELRTLETENRALLRKRAEARDPESLRKRAKVLGVQVQRPPSPGGAP